CPPGDDLTVRITSPVVLCAASRPAAAPPHPLRAPAMSALDPLSLLSPIDRVLSSSEEFTADEVSEQSYPSVGDADKYCDDLGALISRYDELSATYAALRAAGDDGAASADARADADRGGLKATARPSKRQRRAARLSAPDASAAGAGFEGRTGPLLG
ncbi:hypothetical protein M885DRAFT_17804, partial [Pelagophyceae sp. CCMP2097]